MSRPSSEDINYNDDYVGEFDASICSGENLMIFLRIRKKSLLKIQLFGSTVIFLGK